MLKQQQSMSIAVFFLLYFVVIVMYEPFALFLWLCYWKIWRYALEGPLKGILRNTDEDVVSNDFVGD